MKKDEVRWYIGICVKYATVLFTAILLVVIGERVGYNRAKEDYALRYAEEEKTRAIEAMQQNEEDPYSVRLDEEAELLAKVLYGVKDNNSDDLRTYCWCVFNRVDNPSFSDTLEGVIAQPNQWMRYSPDNPVITSLYQIAKAELDKWHTDSKRPVSSDYVFMSWRYDDICLRDSFKENSRTHYWRYGQ